MKVTGRCDTEMYGQYTLEVYTFDFDHDGRLNAVLQAVHFDKDGDGMAETNIVDETEITLVDVPNSVIEDVHEKLHTAASEI